MLQIVDDHITKSFVPFQEQLKVSDLGAQLLNYIVLGATPKAISVLREDPDALILTC